MTLELITGKDYISHSAMSTWLGCGWQYYLTRVQHVPEAPSYWLAGGKAVHEATEKYDRLYHGTDKEWSSTEAFMEFWQHHMKESSNGLEWRTGGRATKQYPNKEDDAWWIENGPKMVDYWVQFRENSGWDILAIDGKLAIETELNQEVNGVKIKAFLDRIMIAPTGELVIVDIKTGSKEPAALTQLGIYSVLVEKQFGIRINYGSYYMARTGELSEPKVLTRFTEQRLGTWAKGFEIAVSNQIFIPSPGFMCNTCPVNKACYAVDGEDSKLYPEITIGAK